MKEIIIIQNSSDLALAFEKAILKIDRDGLNIDETGFIHISYNLYFKNLIASVSYKYSTEYIFIFNLEL